MAIIGIASCSPNSPNVNIIKIIDGTEQHLFETSSLDELKKMHFDMLDNIKNYLDNEHNGYRYIENSEDFNIIMDRFHDYNYKYTCAIGIYIPELNWNTGDKERIAHLMALMKFMEYKTITKQK